MNYTYYPGCSLEATAREYNLSTQAVMDLLGNELEELEDWNCCGASAAEISSHLLSLVLPARASGTLSQNLSLGRREGILISTICFEAQQLTHKIHQAASTSSCRDCVHIPIGRANVHNVTLHYR